MELIPANEQQAVVLNNAERAQLDTQIATAKAYPRSISRARTEIMDTISLSEEIAQSCIYCLPRAQKDITGPSVRLAEIAGAAWGNLHMGKRVIGVEGKKVVAEAIVWDLEKNNKITVVKDRRATDKSGKLFSDDMLIVTGNACAAIALRDAIFNILPRALVDEALSIARLKIAGSDTLDITKIEKLIERLHKYHLNQNEILTLVNRKTKADITSDDFVTLIGIENALRDGYATKEQLFNAKLLDSPTQEEEVPEGYSEKESSYLDRMVAAAEEGLDKLKEKRGEIAKENKEHLAYFWKMHGETLKNIAMKATGEVEAGEKV